MARKKKSRARRREVVEQGIKIERNVIEQSLMDVKEFIKKHGKVVLYGIIAFLIIFVLFIAGLVYLEKRSKRDQVKFEKIMASYYKTKMGADEKVAEKTAKELKDFIDSSKFGFSHRMAHYLLGSIYFDNKRYKEAHTYLIEFAEKSSSDIFAPLAVLKAGIALEEAGDFNGAIELYKEMEETYPDSLVTDQMYYNLARIYGKKRDFSNSRKYYNKVISSYPQSVFVAKAKKNLFLLGKI